jgi:hypothetical protein
MVSGGGSSSSSKTTVWKPQQKYLEDLYGRAEALSHQPQPYYGESSVVPFSREREMALSGTAEMARRGSPDVGASQAYNQMILGGGGMGFMDPASNPYLEGLYDTAARGVTRHYRTAVAPGTSSRFEGAGRGGSGAEVAAVGRDEDALGRNLNELASQIYAPAYQQAYGLERGAQEAAAGRAFQYPEYAYGEMDRLGGVGQTREELEGRYLQDLMDRFYYPRREEASRMAEYKELIGAPTMESRASSMSANVGIMSCSRHLKDLGDQVDVDELLDAAGELPLYHWTYKNGLDEHLGPVAEDFADAFGVGDGKGIDPIDAFGVLFGVVKGLVRRVKVLEAAHVVDGRAA